jgi:hypothetical protein
MNKPIVILFFIIILTIYFYGQTNVSIKSNIDGRYYTVKNNKLKQESADLLATVNKKLLDLVYHIENLPNKPIYSDNLKRFKPDKVHENVLNFDTTYTLDKGSYMAFCLGPRYEGNLSLYDLNTMMYVAIHELAHVASNSVGHTDEFKINFADLLRKAISIGIYTYIDYSANPVEYCGIKLTKSILKT